MVIKPRDEISNVNSFASYPLSHKSSIRDSYFEHFRILAFSIFESKGTVSSNKVIDFSVSLTWTISGLRVVINISDGIVEIPRCLFGRSQ